jgi:hypothetical protein
MLIDSVKTTLRISHNKLDDDISQHISACLDDMKRLGIAIPDDVEDVADMPLLFSAVKIYCMAQFDFLNKGEQYKKGYESLRDTLSLSSNYRESDSSV